MADHRNGGGTNSRPLNDTVAQTGPGIADDALLEGEAPPEPLDEAEVARAREALNQIGSVSAKD
jgi:hypothetical protein